MEMKSFFENKMNVLYEYINYTYEHELNEDIIKKAFDLFLLDGNLLANYVILQDDISAFYDIEGNYILCSPYTIKKKSEIFLKDLMNDYNLFEKDKLLIYLHFFTILHEIMHVYQWKKSNIFFPNDNDDYQMVNNLYDYYTNFLQSKNSRIYRKNQHNYFIERNASLETFYILENVSKIEKNELLKSYMSMLVLSYEYLGYQKNRLGSIYETYANTKQKKAFNNIYKYNEISFLEKLRYGLPLSEEEYDLFFDRIENFKKINSKVIKIKK